METEMKSAYMKYISSLLMFGTNGIVASYILLNSYEIVFWRTLIGGLFLLLVFIWTKQKFQFFINKIHLLYLLISGVAMGASWMFLYEAFTQIGVSIATLAYYCGPVIVMILSPLIFKEKLTSAKIVGFLAVIIGLICVNGQVSSEGGTYWGFICGILSAIMYAVMVIFNKKAKTITGLENSMWQLFTSFLTVSIFIGIKQGFSVGISQGSLLPILLLGVVNTGIGCYLYFSSIGSLSVQTVSILGALEPLSALIFSAAILGEKLSPIQMIGAVLIIGGAAIGELYRKNKNEQIENKETIVL